MTYFATTYTLERPEGDTDVALEWRAHNAGHITLEGMADFVAMNGQDDYTRALAQAEAHWNDTGRADALAQWREDNDF